MDPTTPPPPDDTAPWAAWDDPGPASPTRRPPWLLVVGVVPWLVLAVVLAGRGRSSEVTDLAAPAEAVASPSAPAGGAGVPGGGGALSPASPSGGSGVGAGAGAAPGAGAVVTGRVVASGARVAPDDREAAAVATLVARAWLTGVGPRLEIPGLSGPAGSYAEHLVVEAVDHPAPGAAVVTLLALVLRAEGDTYRDAEVQRIAVPLWFDEGGARPAGPPWRIAPPDLAIASPQVSEAITDPEVLAAAGEALAAAGYVVTEVTSLGRVQGWPLVVTAVATAPGSDTPAEHVLWLREHLGELVVAGSRPAPTPTPEDAP